MMTTSPRFPTRATRFEDAAHDLWQRAVQAVAEGWRWDGAVEQLVDDRAQAWGARAWYTDPQARRHQAVYVYEDHTRRGHYRRHMASDPTPVVTAPDCDLEAYLTRHGIPHQVIGALTQTAEYQGIARCYGDRRAARSGVYFMHHIDEGLRVLRDLGASLAAQRAYCLHPVVQEDAALARHVSEISTYTTDPHVALLMMEYRHVANRALSHHAIRRAEDIDLGPLPEVADMLRADKVQNYKDFLLYHQHTHPRRDALRRYFELWLERLELSSQQVQAWRDVLDVPMWRQVRSADAP